MRGPHLWLCTADIRNGLRMQAASHSISADQIAKIANCSALTHRCIMPPRTEPQEVERMAQIAAERFMQEQAMQFCECAINLMATCMPIAEVIAYLEAQADIMKEYG